MDHRLRRYLESESGVPLDVLGGGKLVVRESRKRTEERGNRVQIERFAGLDGLLATVLPGHVPRIESVLAGLSPAELFSPLGYAELRRALDFDDEPSPDYYFYGYSYALTSLEELRSASGQHLVRALGKEDIPGEQLALRMKERHPAEQDDFIWAFACDRDDAEYHTGAELAPFGSHCASIAIVIWREGPVGCFGVGTDEACRKQGYGLAVVSAATEWILKQGEVAIYSAYANNIPSLRIARRLGFTFLGQHMAV